MRAIFFGTLITTFILFHFSSDAQPKNIIPPSPEAAALGKYGDFDVNLSTGILQQNIPLYAIKTNKLSLSISLNYAAPGVKVNDVASWVGLGWVLNAGGVITRSVRGFPDEYTYGYLFPGNRPIQISGFDENYSTDDFNYLYKVSMGTIDTQPDVYYFNFGEHTGKFVFDSQGTIVPLTHEKIKIEKIASDHFEITTADGIKYVFKDTESTTTPGHDGGDTFISSWYLSEIISNDNMEKISFFYTSDDAYSQSWATQTDGLCATLGGLCGDNSGLSDYGTYTVYHISNAKTLSRIDFKGGKILISSAKDRQDISYGYRLLNMTIIRSYASSTTVTTDNFVKGWDFSYDYLNSTLPSPNFKRLLLKTIAQRNYLGTQMLSHSFDYYDQHVGGAYSLPQIGSRQQDQWGFYNGAASNENDLSMIPTMTYNGTTRPGANRNSGSVDYMDAGTLKKITYPTGGSSLFEYESNQVSNPTRTVGGLRIKLITNYGIDGAVATKKTFSYTGANNSISSGNLISEPLNGYIRTILKIDPFSGDNSPGGNICAGVCVPYIGPGSQTRLCDYYMVTSYDLSSLGSTDGSHIIYGKVTEAVVDGNNNNNGTTENYFTVGQDGGDYGQFPLPPHSSLQALRGQLTRQTIKDKAGNMVMEKSFEYQHNLMSRVTGLIVGQSMGGHPCYMGEAPGFLCRHNELKKFDYVGYHHYAYWSYLKKKTEIAYDALQHSVTTETNYSYDNTDHLQLTKQTTTSGTGKINIQEFKYPMDFSNTDATAVINDMKGARFIHNQVLQTISKIQQNGTEQVVGSAINVPAYFSNSLGGNTILPQETAVLQNDAPVDLNAFALYKPSLGYDITKYKKDISFAAYDAEGNVKQYITKDGVSTSIIWGYNNTVPVAEIKGITYSDAISQSGINTTTINDVTTTDNAMRLELNKLRSLSGAVIVTTYTYRPLVGLTSKTDPNGRTTYFEYDDFSRLKLIRDQDTNILKTFDYQYVH